MAGDGLEALRRITKRRRRAEGEWRKEIRRLFETGHAIEEIAAAAGSVRVPGDHHDPRLPERAGLPRMD
jgi:hypothetical protein